MKLPAASSGVSTSHHSPHLRRKRRGIGPEEIQDKFGSRVKKIVMPREPGAAIEMGAASLGLDPSVILSAVRD